VTVKHRIPGAGVPRSLPIFGKGRVYAGDRCAVSDFDLVEDKLRTLA
jgi:hypothetical protein